MTPNKVNNTDKKIVAPSSNNKADQVKEDLITKKIKNSVGYIFSFISEMWESLMDGTALNMLFYYLFEKREITFSNNNKIAEKMRKKIYGPQNKSFPSKEHEIENLNNRYGIEEKTVTIDGFESIEKPTLKGKKLKEYQEKLDQIKVKWSIKQLLKREPLKSTTLITYMNYLKEKFPELQTCENYLHKVTPKKLPVIDKEKGKEFLAIPFIIKKPFRNHIALIFVDTKNKRIEYYDPRGRSSSDSKYYSLYSKNQKIDEFLKDVKDKYGYEEINNEKVFVYQLFDENPAITQRDNYNCGIYVLDYIEKLLKDQYKFDPKPFSPKFSYKNPDDARLNMAKNLLKDLPDLSDSDLPPSYLKTKEEDGSKKIIFLDSKALLDPEEAKKLKKAMEDIIEQQSEEDI